MPSQIKSPGTIIDEAGVGTVVWSNPDNAKVSDDAYATVVLASTDPHYLKATNFGFTIPVDATIIGIVFEVEAKTSTGAIDGQVRSVKGGSVYVGYSVLVAINTSEDYNVYPPGDTENLWGQSWTPAEINDIGFGMALYTTWDLTGTVSVDHMRATVYYQETIETSVQAKASIVIERTTNISAKASIVNFAISSKADIKKTTSTTGALINTSEGPNSPKTMSDNDVIGTEIWGNVDGAKKFDSSRAYVILSNAGGGSSISHYLKASNFGFNIPWESTINGILVEITKNEDASSMYDNAVRIVKGGVIGATDKASLDEYQTYPSENYVSHGGASDLWGESWAVSDINDSSFGFVLSSKNLNAVDTGTVRVNYIRITVYYETVMKTISKASIKVSGVSSTISAKSNVVYEVATTATAKANIVGVVLNSITAKANIFNAMSQSVASKASIKILGLSTSISAKAELIIERLKNAQAKARIIKQSNIKKTLIYKLYQPDGTFIKVLNQEEILSDFQVNKNVNGGVGNLRVVLNKPIDDYDEYDAVKNPNGAIKYGNRIKVFLTDRYNTDKVIFFGYLVAIGPQYTNGKEEVELSFYSGVSKLSNDYYNTSGSPPYEPTEPAGFYVTETAVSASIIIKNILDNFILQTTNPMVSYTWAGSIVDCANTITYTFDRVKHLESLGKIEEYLPATWYWYVDAEGVMYVRDSSVQTEHKLIIGKDIRTIQAHKNMESVINYFILWNGRSTADASYVFREKTDATSKTDYDRITLFQQDSKVLSDAVADIRKDKVIAFRKDPKQELTIEVTSEYDIASLEPGQRVNIRNIRSNNQTTFADGLVIRRISYRVDSALVELAEIGSDFVKANSAEETAINIALKQNESALESLQAGVTPITDVNIWSGGNQFIEDTVVYSPIISGVNGYFKESIRLGDDGVGAVIRSYGKGAFNNAVAGFWLEKDASNDVKFELYKDANNYFRVDLGAGTFSFAGTMIIAGGSGLANLSDAGALALLDEVGASDCDVTIISGGKIITGLLTASNIQTGTLSSILIQTSQSANTGVKMSSAIGGIDIFGETLEFKDTSGNSRGSIYGLGGLILKAASGNNINYQGTAHYFNNKILPNYPNTVYVGDSSNPFEYAYIDKIIITTSGRLKLPVGTNLY